MVVLSVVSRAIALPSVKVSICQRVEWKMQQSPTEIYKSIVYVLARGNGSNAKQSKVGSTRVSPQHRAKNYTDGGWTVFYELEVAGPLRFHIERTAHEILSEEGYWIDPASVGDGSGSATETFACPPAEAQKAVQSAFDTTMMQMMTYIDGHPNLRPISKLKNDEAPISIETEIEKLFGLDDPLQRKIRQQDAEIAYMREVVSDYKNRIQILENDLSDCKLRMERLSG